jgi:thiamine biosynthesis lipoprotein
MDAGHWLRAGAAALVLPAQAAGAVESRHGEHVLGTSFELFAVGAHDSLAEVATHAAMAEVNRLDASLSAWRSDSELAALNCASSFRASPDLYAVIARCEDWRTRTGGAFSARLGHVRAVWRNAALQGEAPPPGDLSALAEAADCAAVALDPHNRLIVRPDEVQFDIDGLAKGYVLDCAMAAARAAAPEAEALLIDIGGDTRAWSGQGRARPWRIGIADPSNPHDNASPLEHVRLWSGGLAMSGAGARDLRIGAEVFSHTLDPRNGLPVTHVAGAGALAPNAADADALASAFSVLAPRQSLALANARAGVGALVIGAKGDTFRSANWTARLMETETTAPQCQAVSAATPALPWPDGFVLDVSFEIPRSADANYRRPYVAVWISDENRRLVRTLLVLGPQARWREENYIWWRRFERHDLAAAEAIARPTRAPGRYEVRWDGRDNAGALIGRGHYVLNIEASREHGGHSIQTISLPLGAAPLNFNANAAPELGPARIVFGRAS